ncbi:MAG: saccharopine dehydrogenase NADP-binding domain-containing protein [Bacteroidales bacterium]|mgnify:CR=1 FL=1|nr:saccharopine dehydrogenase NADP-binding domain-containing protein [Bacteroidales bacterium]HOY38993.1 saccharopine dehydrogenase C-terminal domain-containing protein [Bacteroidales bacterium]HQP03457.1 saccharopine dehydrogenase C-terminal domain-containing protein [Bacteroidales bacterium]
MKTVLILGAGLSATSLIEYLLEGSEKYNWQIIVGDSDPAVASRKIKAHPNARSVFFDVLDNSLVQQYVSQCDTAVSFLPARFHPIIAKACAEHGKNMVTASYVSPEMRSLDAEAKAKGLIFINEVGVDPGLDHMSAMHVIDEIRNKGGKLLSFKSSTGGLIAPDYDDNPWNYKFTWNPRNVVLAGQGTARFIRNGRYKFIPYHNIYRRVENTEIPGYGEFEIYANRDSLSYRETYGLIDIPTIFRGTMRRPGYCEAWNVFVQLGITDDTYIYEGSENATYRDFINSYLRFDPNAKVEDKLCDFLGLDRNGEIMKKLEWLGIFEERRINMKNATPAQILQKLLEEKWALGADDKDMIVMQHQFEYELHGKRYGIKSSMVFIGKDQANTAMAITVGIPAAIATKMVLIEAFTKPGVHVPVTPDLYGPILKELETYGIRFSEEHFEL